MVLAGHLAFQRARLLLHPFGVGQDGRPFIGQDKAAAGSLEQGLSDIALQGPQPAPHRPARFGRWRGLRRQACPPAGAETLRRDLPDAEIHFLDTGHFGLETHHDEIAGPMRGFLGRSGDGP